MSELKWYYKLLLVLLSIIFSPLIIIALVYVLLQTPKHKKKYKKSRYYKDFGCKYFTNILNSPEYRFYNSAVRRKLPIKYIKQESNGFEYFIFNNTVFLFPDFEQLDYNEENANWIADFDGDWKDFDKSFSNLLENLDGSNDLPVKILIERKMCLVENLNNVGIPECICLTWDYENAFENDDSPLIMTVPQNAKDLYEMMLKTSDLCGDFKLCENDGVVEGKIEWNLYENVKVELCVDHGDCIFNVIEITSENEIRGITHWHPSSFEIYNEVCKIGKCGNVLVISTSFAGAGAIYIGNKDECPYSSDKKYLFKKLYYLEAK